jgi:ribosomal protein S18 acetylase RimI-like enzyme
MKFRHAELKDIIEIMKIIKDAQKYLKNNNIDQWQNNYPNRKTIENDIKSKNSYVLEKDKQVIAYSAFIFAKDKTYQNIYKGKWLNDNDYAVIHRLAVAEDYKGQGIASLLIEELEKQASANGINTIRIDTHQDNLSMQKLIKKNNFIYCGIIYTETNAKRLAYQKDF